MYIVFDIGATKMRSASSKNAEEIEHSKIVPTPGDFQEGIRVFYNMAKELAGGEKIEAAAGGAAGPLDKERAVIMSAPNLKGWQNAPLKSELERICQSPGYL